MQIAEALYSFLEKGPPFPCSLFFKKSQKDKIDSILLIYP